MIRSLFACIGAFLLGTSAHAEEPLAVDAYGFEFVSIDGEPLPLSDYKGKVLMIVNTASKCGFTGQYTGLQELYDTKKEEGLVILGVPSNDFGGQEPGTEEEIKEFCQNTYAVTFPLTSKNIVSGDEAHPFYKWARQQVGWPGAPKWNFHKYIIGRDGKLVDYFSSMTAPDSANLGIKIDAALAAQPEKPDALRTPVASISEDLNEQ